MEFKNWDLFDGERKKKARTSEKISHKGSRICNKRRVRVTSVWDNAARARGRKKSVRGFRLPDRSLELAAAESDRVGMMEETMPRRLPADVFGGRLEAEASGLAMRKAAELDRATEYDERFESGAGVMVEVDDDF